MEMGSFIPVLFSEVRQHQDLCCLSRAFAPLPQCSAKSRTGKGTSQGSTWIPNLQQGCPSQQEDYQPLVSVGRTCLLLT